MSLGGQNIQIVWCSRSGHGAKFRGSDGRSYVTDNPLDAALADECAKSGIRVDVGSNAGIYSRFVYSIRKSE